MTKFRTPAFLKSARYWTPILFGLFAHPVFAHPHSWITTMVDVKGDDSTITGFHMRWEFDAMTSAYTLDGEDTSEEALPETLKTLANDSIQNMLPEHYFTYFYSNDEPVRYLEVDNANYTLDKGKLTLSFDLDLEKPQPIQGADLKLLIFEPSYYIDMSWQSKDDIKLSDALAKNCQVTIIEPTPTPEQMSYAMALPADADPDNALGQLFTQTATFECNK